MTKPAYRRLKVQVQLVRDLPENKAVCRSPGDAYKLVRDELAKADREKCLSLILNSRNQVVGIDEVSVGSLNSSIIHPREVYKSAILANAASIILVHNHPSSDVEPSEDDLTITKRLWEAGKIIGIDLVDHLIVGRDGFLSFKSKKLL
jgi:DNA repair protein RadC